MIWRLLMAAMAMLLWCVRLQSVTRVNTESIVTAAGTSFANHLAMAALVQPGDEVLFEQPAYEPMLATVRYLGADVKTVFPKI
jgi:aspartate/methionine/tyrosine aminotransferase